MTPSREEMIETLKNQLDELNEWIDKAETRLSELTGPAREKLEPRLESARSAYEDGKERLAALRAAGEESFDKLRDEAEHVWKTFKQSVNYFKSQL